MDIVYNTIGVQNVFLGRYIRTNGLEIKGPGIHDLIASVAPDKARDLKKQLERSVAATRAIPVPFDQAFLGRSNAPGRQALRAAIKSLLKQSELIAKSASALGIRLNI
jgi:putative iron-regulated protein